MKWRKLAPFLRAFWHRPADYLPCGTPRVRSFPFPSPWMIPDRSSPSRVVAHAELERKRTRELARIGSNLNQIARWANIHKENAEALEVVAHLVAIERTLDTLTERGEPR